MKHYRNMEAQFKKVNKRELKDAQPRELMRIILGLSNRIDMLEKFVSDNTEFDGEKIGFTMRHGPDKRWWTKNDIMKHVDDQVVQAMERFAEPHTVCLDKASIVAVMAQGHDAGDGYSSVKTENGKTYVATAAGWLEIVEKYAVDGPCIEVLSKEPEIAGTGAYFEEEE